MKKSLSHLHWILVAVAMAMLAACASQKRPEGGPRDETPPVFVRSNPAPEAKRVKNQRIDIFFDENVQIKDAMTKVVVSPAQSQTPTINANGKRVTVELRDTMIPDMTYTIDFSDAISDLNEGNIIDGFAMEFSTGDSIDSLRISGMLFEARTLEPAQGMLVGVHSNPHDSALSTLRLERIAKTNQLGQFTIRGLKPGNYRVYAINDVNRDYMWNRGEDVAFYDYEVSPSAHSIIVTDTLLSSENTDSLVTRPGTEYLPNDILMTWFNEDYAAQYLQNYSRPDSTRIEIIFAAKSDTLPELTIIGGPNDGRKIDNSNSRLNASLTLDTLAWWITDPAIYSRDSLLIAARYLKTDSTDNLSWTTDTLKFNFRRPKVKEKKKKKDEDADSVPKITFLNFEIKGGHNQDLHLPQMFVSDVPLDTIDPDGVHLWIMNDTVWEEIDAPAIVPDTINRPMRFKSIYSWLPGQKYKLSVDSAAITSVYGTWNKPVEREFTTLTYEDYSSIIFNIQDTTGVPIMVELLNAQDMPVATAPAVNGVATFTFLPEGKYYARAFIDTNGDGIWTTGNVAERRQPEEIYYYTGKFDVKKNRDFQQTWHLFDTPVDMQKPIDIKKNKPKLRDGEERRNEEEEDDGWGSNFYPGQTDRYGNRVDNNSYNNTYINNR